MPDELDKMIADLADRIAAEYGIWGGIIHDGVLNRKWEIRRWLKANKKKLIQVLEKL